MRIKIPARLVRWARILVNSSPLTLRGLVVASLSGLALWQFGYGSLDLPLFVTGVSGLVLVGLCVLAVTLATLYVRRHVHADLATHRLEAGSALRTGFEAPALSHVPLIKIRWRWVEPHGVECRAVPKGKRLHEEVVATRRGQALRIRRRLEVADAFGLAAIAWHRTDPGSLLILPFSGRLKNMPVLQPLAASEGLPHPMGAPEGDRMEIRRYVPGDSVRNILWKTFARTRQLNVRIPEKSIDRARKTVAYLLTGPGDEPAAAAARVALESDILGANWLFAADGTNEPTESLDQALQAIARSRDYRFNSGSEASGLASFLERQSFHGDTHCVVFAPAQSGSWTESALAAARNFPGAVSFVLGTDGVFMRGPSPLWQRFLFAEATREGTSTDELSELLGLFERAGDAVVVDRVSGKTFGRSHGQNLGAVS